MSYASSGFQSTADIAPAAPSGPATAGTGGDDLDLFSLSRRPFLKQYVGPRVSNESSYTVPAGFADSSSNSFPAGFQNDKAELSLGEDADSLKGEGGETLALFFDDRDSLLKRYGASGASNASSYATPKGFIDSASNRFPVGVQNETGEIHMGLAIEGRAIAPNGFPLAGTVEIVADGDPYHTSAEDGIFIISSPPPEAAVDGENGTGLAEQYDAVFIPKADAVNSEKNDIQFPDGGKLEARYGIVHGYVTGESGDPVKGATVTGEGSFTTTDSTGYYTLYAPGGRSVSLRSIDGTATEDVDVVAGQDGTRVDWQYAGLQVRVLGPEYNPVEGAPVRVDGDVYRTDENGQVVLSSFPLGEYTIEVMESHEETIGLTGQGALAKRTIQGGSRLKIRCYDAESGDEAANVPAIDVEAGTLSYSNRRGLVQLLTFEEAGFDVLVGDGDRRYLSEPVEASPDDGETAEAEVTLKPQPAVTNQ